MGVTLSRLLVTVCEMRRTVLLLALLGFSAGAFAQPADTTDRSWEFQYPRQIVNLIKGRLAWTSGGAGSFAARGGGGPAGGAGSRRRTAEGDGGGGRVVGRFGEGGGGERIDY